MNINSLIEETCQIAKDVGKFIRHEAENFDRGVVETKKAKSDLVSYVDKQAEVQLVKRLKNLIPDCGFITEENTIEQLTNKAYTWIIDPLDGTTNFIHGVPTYAVSIGLLKENELVGGVVYEINHDECFYGTKGEGAYLNGNRISTTKVQRLDESLFATGFPIYDFERMNEYLAILNELMKSSHGIRRLGSAAADLVYVACGRLEGFFEYNLNPWDVAAGALIVQEAGGTVTDFKGGNDFLFGREIVAGGAVQGELLRVIRQFW